MKVIELLNKIANEEEVPKKIRYKYKNYIYSNECKGYYLGTNPERIETFENCGLLRRIFNGDILNEEVEIIEEDKKIGNLEPFNYLSSANNQSVINENFNTYFKKANDKINEIIDYLKDKQC